MTTRMAFSEDDVRNSLADQLSLIEDGLNLIAKEKYVPSRIGTKSFIDLFARDRAGRTVLIEVKRTNAASREAIHELLKYLESVKAHLGLRDDEIRLMVASSEWQELFVPFSSFVGRVAVNVVGFSLDLSDTGEIIACKRVDPLPVPTGRLIAPWHEVRYYEEIADAEAGIQAYQDTCRAKGIQSFVILELHPSAGLEGISSPKQGSMRDVISTFSNTTNDAPLPLYKRVLYFSMQQLTESEYCEIYRRLDIPDEEREEIINIEASDDEKLCTLHEAILDANPRPDSDFFEIGYSAKLTNRLLDEDGWNIFKVHRYGAFLRSEEFLSDQAIINEMSGDTGANLQTYRKNFNPKDKAQLQEVRRGIIQVLSENPAWKRQIRAVLDDIEADGSDIDMSISIYNPSTSLFTFYLAVSNENGTGYIPEYSIRYSKDDIEYIVYGCLVWDGSKARFENILKKHYEGSIAELMHPLLWGGYDTRDSKVMKSIGFRYRTFRIEAQGAKRSFFSLTDDGWEDCDERHPYQDFFRIYEENSELMSDVCNLYASRWSNGIADLSDA